MGLAKKHKGHELKKHAATIHCSNALSLLQRKISNALLYHAYPDMLAKEEHEINIKQLCHLIAYQGNNHAAIKEALKGLLSTVIEWNVVSDVTGLEDWTASSILASVSLRGPVCYYAYSPRMKQLLHSPSMFGKIHLGIQSQFKSSYGLALYENCIRYRGLPQTKWFDMELFRKLMGVPVNQYTIFRDFKRRVIDKAMEEVNQYADLTIELELERAGRQVTHVRFHLKEKPQNTLLEKIPKELPVKLLEQLQQFGLTEKHAKKLVQQYGEEAVTQKITLITASKNVKQGRVHNLAGYLISALKEDYQLQQTASLSVASEDTTVPVRAVEKIHHAYAEYREHYIDQFILKLAEDEKKIFMENFHQYAADAIQTILRLQRQRYTAETVFNSPQIKAHLRQFALQIYPELAAQLLPLEKFVETLPDMQQRMWENYQAALENSAIV